MLGFAFALGSMCGGYAAGVPSVNHGPPFVYRPGGGTSGNVYGTQAALDAAIAATSGPVEVEIDDSIQTPAVLTTPVVPWRPAEIRNVELVGFSVPGAGLIGFPALQISAALPALATIRRVYAVATGAVSPITLAASEAAVILLEDAYTGATGTAPFIDASATGASLVLIMRDANHGNFDPGMLAKWSASTTNVAMLVDGQSVIADNAFTGPNGVPNIFLEPGASISAYTHPGVTGGPLTFNFNGVPGEVGPARVTAAAVAQAAVASPAGQVAGGAASVNAPFAMQTLQRRVGNPGNLHVYGSLEVTTSVAALVTVTITARPDAGGLGNFAAQYTTRSQSPGAGPVTVPFDVVFDGAPFARLPASAAGATDVGIEVDVSAGTITSVANHGVMHVEEGP